MKFNSTRTSGQAFRGAGTYVFFLLFMVIFLFESRSYAAPPLITDDTGTQGARKFQVEVNGEYAQSGADSETQLSVSLSAGVMDNIDLVITTPYQFLHTKCDGVTITGDGISDVPVELKWRFYDKEGLSFALKPGIVLPTGDEDEGLGDGKPAYSLFLITTKEADPLAVHVNLGYIKNRGELRDIWHYSVAGEYSVSEPLRIVANIGGETNPDRDSGLDPLFLIGGFVYGIREDIDLDSGIKIGLNEAEADYALLAGITFRF